MSLITSCIFTLFNFDIIIHVSMFCKQLKHNEVNTRCFSGCSRNICLKHMIKVEQLANHRKRYCALHVQSKGVEVRAVDGHVTHPLPHVGGWSLHHHIH